MRYIILSGLLITVSFVACKKNSNDKLLIPDGIYKGTFQRQVSGTGQISTVSISFTSGKWTGQSQFAKYPALCNGTYQTNLSDRIIFKNACVWTAEFDWTLILSDTFQIKTVGNEITFYKDYNGVFQDIYILRKE